MIVVIFGIGLELGFLICWIWLTYINGLLNFERLGIIIDIALISALVVATIWYAGEVNKQTKLTVNERKRPMVLEEIQTFLTPAINHLTDEIIAIQNNKFIWHTYTSGGYGFTSGITRLFQDEQYGKVHFIFYMDNRKMLNNYIAKFPILDELLTYHDKLIDDLNELYIKKDKVKSKAKDINKPYKSPPEITEIREKIRKQLNMLKGLNNQILEKMEEIRDNYRKEFNFKYEDLIELDNRGFGEV